MGLEVIPRKSGDQRESCTAGIAIWQLRERRPLRNGFTADRHHLAGFRKGKVNPVRFDRSLNSREDGFNHSLLDQLS